ncbi:hypothetical protein C3Y89_32985 [Rhizobium sp. UPM1132]|uniref:putative Ig domain-containing protein n=1 Tax=Rhizobium ruizarguesonis TaxID=2081791 RepID=UPI001447649D|nr:putative Ig domain-containing protein [Rhizobium ruizarguesonis]NKQ75086.1 hypothetical protein [Rhizobium ruizarguesonis]
MRSNITVITFAIAVSALSSAASASEPSVVWRSSTSGVLASPVPAGEAPTTPPAVALAVSYRQNRLAWGVGEWVLVMPDVSGGSGRYEYALANVTPLPASLAFNSATGVFSGRVTTVGDYQWSILVRDVGTGNRTTAVARIVVVK